MTRRDWLLSVASLALPAGLGSGCSLFSTASMSSAVTSKPFLPPLVKPQDAVSVEIMLADRSAGDPMCGTALWSNLNEACASSPASHGLLRKNGFQYGLSPSTPPFAVQALLSSDGKSATHRIHRVQYGLPSGGEHVVETWPEVPLLECDVPSGSESTRQTFKSARCIIRVRVEKAEEGWARFEFTPEIHHGPMLARRVPSDHGWLFQESQEIEALYDLKFAVELNVGELAVIGLNDSASSLLGHSFFRGAEQGPLERVLMIRLADLYEVRGVRQFDRA